jgi:hypothetical protein
MKSQGKLGMNRTGRDTSPVLSKQMLQGTEELTLPRCPKGSFEAIGDNRMSYMLQEPEGVGSVPVPATVKGTLKAGVKALSGKGPTLFLDKLGERLAFERAGVRLYDALISKFKAEREVVSPVASMSRLEEIRSEELKHFLLIAEVMRDQGADPTAVTPAADIAGVASAGIVKVLGEARIGFVQSLDAILIAELADHSCWQLLTQLASEAGLDEVAKRFEQASIVEEEHLETIRGWIQEFARM